MTLQLRRGTGIFGCHKYSLFSDHPLDLGAGPEGWGNVVATPIPGKPAFMAHVPGTRGKVWHNTHVFVRAYKQIQKDAFYLDYDWSVKVDPDTAFIPGALQRQIRSRLADVSISIYFVNCETWRSLQGPLEVLSRAAGERFFQKHEECLDSLDWQPWGEDWFMNQCLNKLGSQAWDGFDLLNDAYCLAMYGDHNRTYKEEVALNGPTCRDGKPAFHPYKTFEGMKTCLDQAEPVHRIEVTAARQLARSQQ